MRGTFSWAVVAVVAHTAAQVTLTAHGSVYCYDVESQIYAESCMLGRSEPFVTAIWPNALLNNNATLRNATSAGPCSDQGYTTVIQLSDPFYQGVDVHATPGTWRIAPLVTMISKAIEAFHVGDPAWRTYLWAWVMTLLFVWGLVEGSWWIPQDKDDALLQACGGSA
mmetsp:Transcript_41302/g.68716  ORF Transcript_41302/g.68716 Transcript_41302/m.68716 type:complete len:167 (+) Transcript_41302:73-573(+)